MSDQQTNDGNNGQKNDPKEQARNLFFQTHLTQAQIAHLVGVSQKTISVWINEGRWKYLKESVEQAPVVLVAQMVNELLEINKVIASREPGRRFATKEEAEIRRKTFLSIRFMRLQQTASVHSEVIINFVDFVRRRSLEDVKTIVAHADEYLRGEVKLGVKPYFKPYSLIEGIEWPDAANDPGTPSGDNTAGDLDKAA